MAVPALAMICFPEAVTVRTEFARPENALIMCLSFLTVHVNKVNYIYFITDIRKGKVKIHTAVGNRTAICVFFHSPER